MVPSQKQERPNLAHHLQFWRPLHNRLPIEAGVAHKVGDFIEAGSSIPRQSVKNGSARKRAVMPPSERWTPLIVPGADVVN